MLDLALLVILVIGFFIGLKRGFILQLIHMTGFIAAFIIAYMYYDQLAPKLTLWVPYPVLDKQSTLNMIFEGANLDQAYYRVIAFALIFFAVKIVLHLVGAMLDFLSHLPIIKQLNVFGGGILGFIEVYLMIFILLYIAVLLPIESVQNLINDSAIANMMVQNTPILSEQVKEWWIEYVKKP
ncbi:putative membrane protein required for colicin V production [Bacillus pakistanensis]|uniref:Membrane protein required for colicin V production n=1 Tax=Rossellomorea pakistanensis TaxID=992288 RepID=A0ABS2NAL5_9BACI|nr:CvpA family protein [Bacillus pakistanensis]MBM7584894.1 putative membrane protein required for colicin V production [Bacillus pakistanensis]